MDSGNEWSFPTDCSNPWVVNSDGDPVYTVGGGVTLVTGVDVGGGTSFTTVYGGSGW
ncbi:hypothetical protein [Streptomyces sp. NPDC048496]|uniref:hypothetical protein n=1 Tax=Streptomyces sp. NPDC048496 TaxID=3365558 RepID=UPI003714BBC9